MPPTANPSDPRGIMRMLHIVPQSINQPKDRYAAVVATFSQILSRV
jgi:hypothetical protein